MITNISRSPAVGQDNIKSWNPKEIGGGYQELVINSHGLYPLLGTWLGVDSNHRPSGYEPLVPIS